MSTATLSPPVASERPQAIDIAIDYFTERASCLECGDAVHSLNGPWIHTRTGMYRCALGTAGNWADPLSVDAHEDALVDKYEEGLQDGREERQDPIFDEGVDKGREEMYDEAETAIDEELTALFAQVHRDDVELTADLVREVIDIALNRVRP